MVDEKRRSVGFRAIHCFCSRKEKKSSYGILIWNFGMEPICMDTCLGLCMDLLVRKPS